MDFLTPQTDREVLIAIHGTITRLAADVQEIKTSFADQESVSSIERRVVVLEKRSVATDKKVYWASGALAVLLAVIKWLPTLVK